MPRNSDPEHTPHVESYAPTRVPPLPMAPSDLLEAPAPIPKLDEGQGGTDSRVGVDWTDHLAHFDYDSAVDEKSLPVAAGLDRLEWIPTQKSSSVGEHAGFLRCNQCGLQGRVDRLPDPGAGVREIGKMVKQALDERVQCLDGMTHRPEHLQWQWLYRRTSEALREQKIRGDQDRETLSAAHEQIERLRNEVAAHKQKLQQTLSAAASERATAKADVERYAAAARQKDAETSRLMETNKSLTRDIAHRNHEVASLQATVRDQQKRIQFLCGQLDLANGGKPVSWNWSTGARPMAISTATPVEPAPSLEDQLRAFAAQSPFFKRHIRPLFHPDKFTQAPTNVQASAEALFKALQ